MAIHSEDPAFWDLVEHEIKVKQPGTWRMTMLLIRLGMAIVLLGASYLLFFYILTPPNGYFFTSLENVLHPIFWIVGGTLFIIAGAYLRFRVMGPIMDQIERDGI